MLSYIPLYHLDDWRGERRHRDKLLRATEREEAHRRHLLVRSSLDAASISLPRHNGNPGREDALTRLQNQRTAHDKILHSAVAMVTTRGEPWWHRSEPDVRSLRSNASYLLPTGRYTHRPSTISEITTSSHDQSFLTDSLSTFPSESAPFASWEVDRSAPIQPYISDPALHICNLFWRPSLTFHPFVCGDVAVSFGALWPMEAELRLVLQEAYEDAGLRSLVPELVKLSLMCGPLRLLKVLLELKIIAPTHRFEDGQTLLHKACIARNLGATLYLRKKGARKNVKDSTGRTPAQVCYSTKIMKVLTENSSTFYRQSPLDIVHHSISHKVKVMPSLHDKQVMFDLAQDPKENDKLLSKLQMFDFDVNKESDEHGNYLVHIATAQGIAQVPLLKLLKDVCLANVNLKNKDGYTALMIASTAGDTIMVDTLLCILGVDPDIQHPDTGRTALHYACQQNHLDTVTALLKRGADYNLEDTDGARPDDLAVIFRAVDCQKIIESQREERIQRLASRLLSDDLTVVDLRPSDLYTVDQDGFTLLMLAARHNCQGILAWICAQKNAPIDAQHIQTLKTALAYAAKNGHVEAVQTLMRHGANPAIKDINGYMPLHNAAIHHQTAVVSVLMSHPQALTGLHSALQLSRHPVIQRDLQNAMHSRQRSIVLPVLFECCVSGDAEKLYRVLEEGDNVNQISGLGDWPIYLAAENGHLEVVKLLYELGGDLERRHQQTGNSVLHAACSQGHTEVTEYILQSFRQGSSQPEPCGMVNALNYNKETPLMRAAYKGSFRLVQLLLDHGASSFVLCPHTGRLFTCDYEGLQYVINNHRKQHAAEVLSALNDWKPLKKLKQVFLPQFDHNIRGPDGDTPLMVACRLGKTDVVKFFLESAVFNIFPSPPSNNKLSMLCYDSDADSGIPDVASCQTFATRPRDLPIKTSSTNNPAPATAPAAKKEQSQLSKTHRDHGYHGDRDEAVPVDGVTPSASFYIPPDSEEEEECAVRDNISTLLDSIASMSRGSIFVNHKRVSHLCAVNPTDGRTAYHRALEGGDNVSIITALLEADNSAINIQDTAGLSPLHLACTLGRKKVLQKLLVEPFVDLNCRTLDGKLPEEMSTTKSMVSQVQKARKNQPISSTFSPFRSLPSSIFGVSSSQYSEDMDGSIDFDTLNTRFMLLKHDLGSDVNMFL